MYLKDRAQNNAISGHNPEGMPCIVGFSKSLFLSNVVKCQSETTRGREDLDMAANDGSVNRASGSPLARSEAAFGDRIKQTATTDSLSSHSYAPLFLCAHIVESESTHAWTPSVFSGNEDAETKEMAAIEKSFVALCTCYCFGIGAKYTCIQKIVLRRNDGLKN